MLVMVVSVQASEDYIFSTFYSDGSALLMPDAGSYVVLTFDDNSVDSVWLDSTAHFQEAWKTLLCTLQTTYAGYHKIKVRFVEAGDTVMEMSDWTNTYQANVAAMSGDSGAADSLKAMMDGTRATLYLNQLSVVAPDGNKPAIVATGNGTGAGIQAASTTGPGIYGQGKYGLHTVGQTNYGFLSEGSKVSGDSAGIAAVGGATIDILGDIGGAINRVDTLGANNVIARVIANTVGTIDGATPTTTGFSATELTQADDYWNDQMIMFLTGNAAGQAARITDFTTATDSITFTPALTATPAQNDSFVILSLFASGATATVSDADKKDITDSVWQRAFADADAVTGSIWDSLKTASYIQGPAAGLDSTAVYGAMEQLSADSNLVRYDGPTRVLEVAGIYVKATDGEDSSAVEFQGDGAGHGFYVHGDLAANAGNTGYGMYSRAAYNGLYGILADAIATGGRAIGATSTGSNGVALYLQGLLDGLEIVSYDPDGRAAYIHSDSGDAIVLWANADSVVAYWDGGVKYYDTTDCTGDCDSVTGINKHAVEMQTWGINDDIMRLKANADSADGISITSGSGAQDIDAWMVGVDTGAGSNAVKVLAVDTSDVDADIADVKITVKTLTGEAYTHRTTGSDGSATFNLNADSFILSGQRVGYVWNVYDTIVVAGAQTDTLEGYDIQIGSPSDADLCRMYGYANNIEGVMVQDVMVTATLDKRSVRDTCGAGPDKIISVIRAETPTNSAGYFYIDLTKSKCLSNSAAKYKLIGTYNGEEVFKTTLDSVPDLDSSQVSW
jgi:hypothetical protein